MRWTGAATYQEIRSGQFAFLQCHIVVARRSLLQTIPEQEVGCDTNEESVALSKVAKAVQQYLAMGGNIHHITNKVINKHKKKQIKNSNAL